MNPRFRDRSRRGRFGRRYCRVEVAAAEVEEAIAAGVEVLAEVTEADGVAAGSMMTMRVLVAVSPVGSVAT